MDFFPKNSAFLFVFLIYKMPNLTEIPSGIISIRKSPSVLDIANESIHNRGIHDEIFVIFDGPVTNLTEFWAFPMDCSSVMPSFPAVSLNFIGLKDVQVQNNCFVSLSVIKSRNIKDNFPERSQFYVYFPLLTYFRFIYQSQRIHALMCLSRARTLEGSNMSNRARALEKGRTTDPRNWGGWPLV